MLDALWTAGLQRAVMPGAGILAPLVSRPPDDTICGFSGYLLSRNAGAARRIDDAMLEALSPGSRQVPDGQWAYARFQPADRSLTLAHDLFGATPLYYAQAGQSLWFSTSFKALLAISEIARQRRLDLEALHTYLVFSYVPAPRTLFDNVRCVPPFAALTVDEAGAAHLAPLAVSLLPSEQVEDEQAGENEARWRAALLERFCAAVHTRVENREGPFAVALSGGLDSAAVATGLKELATPIEAFHLRFDEKQGEEQVHAERVVRHLGIPLHLVTVRPTPRDTAHSLQKAVWNMDQPWGDPVTLPLWLVNRAMRERGFRIAFNGEGGDQLFAGWPNKAMLAAELYGSATDEYDRVDAYLRTFHHFYGTETMNRLYGEELRRAAARVDLGAEVAPHLAEPSLPGLFERLRWTNYRTKGSQNIMPRAAAMARAHGVEMQAPLFDLELARFSLTIPGPLLLRGTTEKYLLKSALAPMLPDDILQRPKRGMGVPATDWCLGPLRGELKSWLGQSLLRRDLFQPQAVRQLLKGADHPGEIRERRVGEKLWQLAVLELWLQQFLDRSILSVP